MKVDMSREFQGLQTASPQALQTDNDHEPPWPSSPLRLNPHRR
jgi:hypothetical protein